MLNLKFINKKIGENVMNGFYDYLNQRIADYLAKVFDVVDLNNFKENLESYSIIINFKKMLSVVHDIYDINGVFLDQDLEDNVSLNLYF